MQQIPKLSDIKQAAERIKKYIHSTPILTCQALNKITGAELYFKCENFQKTGAFKARGASNAVFSLDLKQTQFGVATHSSGNHGAAIAFAAKLRGIPAYIVVPENAPDVKKNAILDYSAKIFYCAPGLDARESKLKKVLKMTKATYIPPYDDKHIIAGQGTAALELLETIKNLDIVITPVGGGGLLSGTAIAVKKTTDTIIVGAEPANVDDAYRSFLSGKIEGLHSIDTVCDGLKTTLGKLNFAIISQYVDHIYTTTEENIIRALQLIWQRMKIIIEPSSAVVLAIILEHPEIFQGKKCGLILSGGNVDFVTLFQQYSESFL